MTKEISNTYRTLVDTPIDQAAEEERNRHIAKLFDGLLSRAEVEKTKLLDKTAALRTRCEESSEGSARDSGRLAGGNIGIGWRW